MSNSCRWLAMCLSVIMCQLMFVPAGAQTILSPYQPGVTTDGAVYFLPKTAVQVRVLVEKSSYKPGEYAIYAQRFLRLSNVGLEPMTTYRVVGVNPLAVAVPDTTKAFAVKFNSKTVAANVALSHDGLLMAINAIPKEMPEVPAFKPAPKQPVADPHQFMNEEIVSAGSTAKMAELTAREIYDLRENRSLIIKGQADPMPADGVQMQLMLNQMNLQDQALTSLFQGVTERDTTEHVITFVPDGPVTHQVLFRLSQRLGLVDSDDLSGVPYYINIENISNLPSTDEEGKARKKLSDTGIYVNVPGKMRLTVYRGGEQLAKSELPAAQFGNVELLSGDLFNKRYTTHLWLNPLTGAVDRLEAEQPK